MDTHLPHTKAIESTELENESTASSSSGDDDDQNWDDWVSDSGEKRECLSLFDKHILPSTKDAVAYDKDKYGVDIDELCSKLGLDFHGRVRMINYIRRNKVTAEEVLSFTGNESWLASDNYLIPVLENDPLLQSSIADDWSDSDDDLDNPDPQKKIRALERQLERTRQSFQAYQNLLREKMGLLNIDEPSLPATDIRDDDTHYFESYGQPDIHAVMIQDKVRTCTYAHFILTNPQLFRDATVLDVGCGTGILSLFAAKSGARRVIAVDASDIAEKARKIVKANELEDVVTVIRGKVENIHLPDGIQQVDIIVSEWMGYALLYESMLDSVLIARDRFLRPGGVIAPSQCRIMLALCEANETYKERVAFWNDVYGFDMSTMAEDVFEEAIVDVVGPETVVSKPYNIKDLILGDVSLKDLQFTSNFSLGSTVDKRTKINAFVLYFDTFFNASGCLVSPETSVKNIQEGDPILAELWPVGGKPAHKRRQSIGRGGSGVTSFSTGPQSLPTHWKQTIFLLRKPITVSGDSVVTGLISLQKSERNSRELDVVIQYAVKLDDETPATETMVQSYKIR